MRPHALPPAPPPRLPPPPRRLQPRHAPWVTWLLLPVAGSIWFAIGGTILAIAWAAVQGPLDGKHAAEWLLELAFLLFALFLNVFPIVAFSVEAVRTRRRDRVYRDGLEATGTVLGTRQQGEDTTGCLLRYAFTDATGRKHTPPACYAPFGETLSAGQSVTVLYDPARPAHSYVYEGSGCEIAGALTSAAPPPPCSAAPPPPPRPRTIPPDPASRPG